MNELIEELDGVLREIYRSNDFIALHQPSFRGREVELVSEAITTGWVSSAGSQVGQFERAIGSFLDSPFAVATVNGTAALQLMLTALQIGPGDEVLCPDLSFVATAAAIVHAGASPVFIDAEKERLGMCPESLAGFLETHGSMRDGICYNATTGKALRACLVMHNVGIPSRMKALEEICEQYGIVLLEDAAEALGSSLDGRACGTIGHAGVLSFNGNKVITTGGGGMLLTGDEALAKHARHLSTTAKTPHPYAYQHDAIGFNFRMPSLNAALGLGQIDTLVETLELKRQQAKYLEERISGLDQIRFINPSSHAIKYNHWFNVIELIGVDQEEFIQGLSARKIMARPVWSSISEMSPYSNQPSSEVTMSRKLANTVVCLPNGVADRD